MRKIRVRTGVLFLLFTLQGQASQSETWTQALARDNNVRAGDLLLERLEQLTQIEREAHAGLYAKPQTVDIETYRSVEVSDESAKYIKSLGRFLKRNCHTCDESARVTLFRGANLDRHDFAIPLREGPLFLSRGVRDATSPNLPAESLAATDLFIRQGLETVGENHARYIGRELTPMISATVDIGVAVGGDWAKHVMVLRPCPQRVYAPATGHRSEQEVQLPFFIHPSEIVAILKVEPKGTETQSHFVSGGYEFVFKNAALSQMSEDKAKEYIRGLIEENNKLWSNMGRWSRGLYKQYADERAARRVRSRPPPLSCRHVF